MLVLGRKIGESIVLGNEAATVTVMEANPHSVRVVVSTLGFGFQVTLYLNGPPLVLGQDWATIAFLSLCGETARLGIMAAKETAIDRSEVRERKLAATGGEWWEERCDGC